MAHSVDAEIAPQYVRVGLVTAHPKLVTENRERRPSRSILARREHPPDYRPDPEYRKEVRRDPPALQPLRFSRSGHRDAFVVVRRHAFEIATPIPQPFI